MPGLGFDFDVETEVQAMVANWLIAAPMIRF